MDLFYLHIFLFLSQPFLADSKAWNGEALKCNFTPRSEPNSTQCMILKNDYFCFKGQLAVIYYKLL